MIMQAVASGPSSTLHEATGIPPRRRSGITLAEILISIMILGVGLVSLATLFPIGLLRLRDAARWSRSATLLETAASDAISRGLFSSQSFQYADALNYQYNFSPWYVTASGPQYNPLYQDTQYYGGDVYTPQAHGGSVLNGVDASFPYGVALTHSTGPGLPFAYDPLWRYQTANSTGGTGYYLDPVNLTTFEARFGYGLTNLPAADNDGNGTPSAHGLPRITNFNRVTATSTITVAGQPPQQQLLPVMPSSNYVPNIFVSQEDVVWQEANTNANAYTIGGGVGGTTVNNPSPVIPDLNTSRGSVTLDWRYTWMFTGQLSNAGNTSTFDGNIVIFENRPFGISTPATLPTTPAGNYSSQTYQVDGEIVVEAIFGYSGNIVQLSSKGAVVTGTPGYGTGADRTVLLRWPTSMPDPVVRAGDWIADVTYERQNAVVYSRFFQSGSGGYPNAANKLEWDNLPAQRCFWYQVQKATPPATDPTNGAGYRSTIVYVNQNLQARTVLSAAGTAVYMNAALIAPNVINVIPQTIFVR
jgi:hypothetical protein